MIEGCETQRVFDVADAGMIIDDADKKGQEAFLKAEAPN